MALAFTPIFMHLQGNNKEQDSGLRSTDYGMVMMAGVLAWSYICFLAFWHELPRSAENFCKFYFIAFSQVESRVDVSHTHKYI